MKRAPVLPFAPLFLLVACQSQPLTTPPTRMNTQQIPAVAVNDPCSAYTTADECKGSPTGVTFNGAASGQLVPTCTWTAVDACPAGATCPSGVCVTASACSSLMSAAACQANTNCVWSEVLATASAPALCPVGQDCAAGGFCFDRGSSSGPGCLCVQPLACPANGACPPVQCDCPPPPAVDAGGGGGGGGTCTCGCPVCSPGEACPPCDCQCGTGGGGSGGSGGGCVTGTGTGAGGTTGAGGGGSGTCTCNCPECPAGAACPACSCSCTNGSTTTMTVPASGTGTAGPANTTNGLATRPAPTTSTAICSCPACPANTACAPCDCSSPPPADPCTAYTDAKSCLADTADQCGWTALAIACFTTPCPSGVRAKTQPEVTSDGGSPGSGCGCACPACPAGATCPACTCNCCPSRPAEAGGDNAGQRRRRRRDSAAPSELAHAALSARKSSTAARDRH